MAVDQLLREQPLALALLVAVVVLAALKFKSSPAGKKLPSPPGALPLVGHLHLLPAERPWTKLKEWSDTYGPIFKIKLGLNNVIIVSDAATAYALLDKRSTKYSSRPRLVMAEELVSRGLRLTFMPYTDLWKKERKYMNQLTSPTAAATYEPLQDLESTQTMIDMLERPKAFWSHCQRYAGSLIMQVAFNKRAKLASDRNITEMHDVLQELTRCAVPGRYLVDSLPFLNYLPRAFAPWKKEGEALFEKQRQLFGRHLEDVKRDVAEGKDARCFVQAMLEMKESGLTDEQISFLAGVMYGAGSDTTADGICTFILTMVKHPEAVAKAQEELDRVIGRDRLPTFNDQAELPYMRALVAEVQRWRPIIAGGLAHATTEDDVYDGYFIPKGTTVIPNAWAIHQDPALYPEPEKFKPERFLDKQNNFVGVQGSDRGHFGFGYGRRVCPGSYIADRSLYIVFSRMLWGFNITYAKDPSTGNVHPVDENAYTSGFSSHPAKFLCDISPRHADVKSTVLAHASSVGLA